jgi:arylsulfatase A-like enzyme
VRCSNVGGSRALASAGLLVAAILACEQPETVPALAGRLDRLQGANLVLIVVDTLRADWTTPYGFAQETSPELARWAARGILFERARAQSSWTKMSMASLMTSLWPRSHGIRDARDGLAAGALTLAEVLAAAGYRTYAVQTNGWLHQSFGFHQGFEHYVFPTGRGARGMPAASLWSHADRVVAEAGRLIDAHPTGEPFFLYLHFMDVHEFGSPNEFKMFGSGDRGHYLAAIRWVDDALERVRVVLDDAGALDETIIVFAADHGETFGENGVVGHARNVLTSVLWVPLIFRLPFEVDPIRVRSQVRNLDIAPTLLELLGVPIPESFEGKSLWPLVLDEAQGVRGEDRVSFAALGLPLFRDASVQSSVNDGAWTYARNVELDPENSEFLYDRQVDPREDVNLIGLEPEEASRLRAILREHREAPMQENILNSNVHIDPEIAERLKAMGYLE